jgi:S-adenosylmethionine hydrolase
VGLDHLFVVINVTRSIFCLGKLFTIFKNIKTILPNYSAIAVSDKYEIKNYEGEKLALFNEAGFLEIAIFRSNPSKVGSANSLLGLNYRDAITIKFI